MKSQRTSRIAQAIADNPWASLQDAVLLSGIMIVAIMLSLEYDLFRYDAQLSPEARRITLAELIFLTVLLTAGITAFILRRLHERRIDAERRTQHRTETHRLRRQAQRDPVTGLPNRRGVLFALTDATSTTASRQRMHTLIVLGLEGIERVNDVYGRATGDNVLKAAADRFRSVARASGAIVGRLEGAEFVVLAEDLDRARSTTLAQDLIAALGDEIVIDHHAHKLGIWAGATMFDGPRRSPAEALHEADLAMRRAKEAQRPGPVFYNATTAS